MFIDRLADAVASRLRGAAPSAAPGSGRRGAKRGRKLDMHCRVEGCPNRSRGPRFHFLCEKHDKELSAKEKVAVAAAYKAKKG